MTYDRSYSCEVFCPCQPDVEHTSLVVLTGGPGAGKTAVLEFARKSFCMHVAILPESASILFGSGYWRLGSQFARRSAQKTIFHIQDEMQRVVVNEKRWAVALCDRGTLDGLAYWPGDSTDFFKELKTSKAEEFAKYAAVIHLRTPSASEGYNHRNPVRIETAEEAFLIDERIHEVWKDHPHYVRIESSAHFNEKLQITMGILTKCLPACCRGHIERSDR